MTTTRMPPWTKTATGAMRRVGVEIEMNGLGIDRLATTVADLLDLSKSSKGRYERTLHGDAAGEWEVEVDFRLLKQWGRDDEKNPAEDALQWLAEPLVPLELVSPPLPLDRLDDLERIIAALRDAGAKGTSDAITNAFGMQLNPEIPAQDAETLLNYLKAYLCLQDWLFERAHVNLARRATPYVDALPLTYARKVVDLAYRPDLATVIDDYLAANPTRNRALDLMPLFAHLDEPRVRRTTDDPLIKARPTFHYRLPNSEIHRPNWRFSDAWNDWLEVERLAADDARLAACCSRYAAFLDRPLDRWLRNWPSEIAERWLGQ
ncbi:MAG: amidoligase family protein [Gammaproteobacteria bacterium]